MLQACVMPATIMEHEPETASGTFFPFLLFFFLSLVRALRDPATNQVSPCSQCFELPSSFLLHLRVAFR